MPASDRTFDQIMDDITAHLTGSWDHDGKYLMEQMEAYKGHELAKEIVRALGRLLYEISPDDLKGELKRVVDSQHDTTMQTLEEATHNMQANNWDKATDLIEPLAKTCDDLIASGWCADDAMSRYFDFRSATDEIVWRVHNEERRTIRRATEPFARVYSTYGSCLVEARRCDEAIVACQKAIRWNPSDVSARFELSECHKLLHDMVSYERVLDELYPYVATATDLARYHRAMGYLRIEQGAHQVAAAHLMLSLLFERSPYPFGEITYIKMEHGQDYTNMSPGEALGTLEASGEKVLIHEDTFRALNQILRESHKHQDYGVTLQTATELYKLTRDDQYRDLAGRLRDMLDVSRTKGE